MRNWKFLLLLAGLFALSLGSCSKDDDDDKIDVGRVDPDDIPTGYVALDKFGMRALFPEERWGNQIDNEFKATTGYEAQFSRDCIATYLKEDSIFFAGHTSYNTIIYFCRLDQTFSSQEEAESLIAEYHYVMTGKWDINGNDPNLEYEKVGEIDFATVGNEYTGSLIETWDKFGYYQANYFVYDSNRLYMITLSMDKQYKEENNAKYEECMKIIKSLKFKAEE
ncbi:MAG: hypothetical protein J6Y37_07000 [Paludibacteraceae bacterium]|nr:hypothetical protein [Paludibacteraceae bacterium]